MLYMDCLMCKEIRRDVDALFCARYGTYLLSVSGVTEETRPSFCNKVETKNTKVE